MKWSEAKVEGKVPAARGGHAGVSFGNSCYYFGGADRTLKVYEEILKCRVSGEVRTWEKVKLAIESAPGCNSRTGCSSTLVGNDMYIFGGQEPHSGTLFNDILKIDLKTLTLSRVDVNGGSPPPRHSHISVLLNDKCLLVFGGAGEQAPLNDTWIFDTETRCWTYPTVTGSIPRLREMHSGSIVGGKRLVVFGGRDREGRVLQDMCILDTEKMVWEKSRGTEFPRCAHSCIAVSLKDAIIAGVLTSSPNESDVESTTQDGLILYGGFSGNNVENSVLFITEDLSTVLDISGQIGGKAPTPSFAQVALPIVNESGFTEAMVSFGGINLSQDANEASLLRFD